MNPAVLHEPQSQPLQDNTVMLFLRRHGVAPDSMLYGTLMSVAGRAGDMNLAFSLQTDMLAEGILPCQARCPAAWCKVCLLVSLRESLSSPPAWDAVQGSRIADDTDSALATAAVKSKLTGDKALFLRMG